MTAELFFLIAILQLLDAYTTVRIIKLGGAELNPLMRWMFSKIGVTVTFIITKPAFLIALYTYRQLLAAEVAVGLLAFYVAIVANNLIVIGRLKKKSTH